MKLSRMICKLDSVEIATCSASRGVKRLRNVAEEMRHPLERVGARQVAASAQNAILHILNATFQNRSLVRNGADYASPFGAVVSVVQTAMLRRKIMCVYPMPLV